MKIDITMPLTHGMAHYPGDPAIEFDTVLATSRGDAVNLTQYRFGSHSGTHVDAPYHILPHGKKADQLPADYFIGTAKVFEFRADIKKEMLEGLPVAAGDIVLFKTPNSARIAEGIFDPNHISVMPCAARHLADKNVRAVGIDCLSIESDSALPVHHILLGAGIPIIEGLDLSRAKPGVYRMTAMPMRIHDSDGAPLRAMLETIG